MNRIWRRVLTQNDERQIEQARQRQMVRERERDQGSEYNSEWMNDEKTTNPCMCIHVTHARQFQKWLEIWVYLSNAYSHSKRIIKKIRTFTCTHTKNQCQWWCCCCCYCCFYYYNNNNNNNKEIVLLDFSPFFAGFIVVVYVFFVCLLLTLAGW